PPITVVNIKELYYYQCRRVVLSDVNIEVNKAYYVYLIGKTGSGKSSFMKTLYADLALTHGEGHIVDFNLKTLKEKDIPFLRRKLGVVFEDFKLLTERTVNDNLQFVYQSNGWSYKIEL